MSKRSAANAEYSSTVLSDLFIAAVLYIVMAWGAFEWRNPKCNEMAFIRHFPSVMTFKRLPEYQ